MEFLKRTWAEIDLNALDHNYREIRNRLPAGTGIMAVVKADGYGHHDRFAALELQELGVEWFGVSNLEEALSLRRCGVTGRILILGFTPPEKADLLAAENITQTILSTDYAARLSAEAVKKGVTVEGHVKLDTGMRRIGFFVGPEDDPTEEIAAVCGLPGLSLNGIFSHFSSSDDLTPEGLAFTEQQRQRFDNVVEKLAHRGITFRLRHLQNSAGILNQNCNYELARAGLILYGMAVDALPGRELDLHPVMTLRSTVAMVKTIESGEPVSYSRTYTTPAPTKVATVPIGYADGYLRMFSNRASVLIRGKRAPIIGNVCMDQMMVDVSGIPDVTEGDRVTVVGRDGGEEITFDELAAIAGTINYELVCLVGKRVPRVCLKDGKVVDVFDYLDL